MTTARRVGATSVAAMFGVAAAVVATSLMAPKWTQAAGLDVWDLPALQNQIENSARKDLIMNAEFEDNRTRMALKKQLIEDLLAERASLKEVTARFLTINRTQESCTFAIRAGYKGATDEEKTARNVISFAVLRLN